MSARLFKRGDIWFAWVPKRGGGVRKVSTQCTDKKAAELRAGQLEREELDPAHAAANKATTADACDGFIASRVSRGRAEGTLQHYRVKLGHVVRLMPERLADVDAASCERFIAKRLAEGAAQTTVKKELRALGATLRHACRMGLYLRHVEAVIPELADTYQPRERFLAPLEFVALVNALPPERAAQIVFIVATGARWGESERARREDVVEHMVMMRGTKTKRARGTVPVPPTMRLALAWSLANAPGAVGDPLFAPWGSVRRDLHKACATLGIEPVSPNDLRRTFATWLRMAGISIDLIAMALRHTTSRMVERVYGRIAPATLNALLEERINALTLDAPDRSPVSQTDRHGTPPAQRDREESLRDREGPLLLRAGEDCLRGEPQTGENDVVRVLGETDGDATWRGEGERQPRVPCLDEHAGAVREPELPSLPELGRAGRADLRQVAVLPVVLSGRRTATERSPLHRPDRQQRELRTGERAMGDEGRASEQPTVAEAVHYPDRHGLLMGGEAAETGHSGASVEIVQSDPEPSLTPGILADSSGAQTRNRTADTGIFNSRKQPVNVGESADSGDAWAANGLTFRARALHWLTRVAA
jgi:integrase